MTMIDVMIDYKDDDRFEGMKDWLELKVHQLVNEYTDGQVERLEVKAKRW